jgi:hypothetical protein
MSNNNVSPEALPSIKDLRRLTQSLAMLDAIINPEWEDRYYSFNSQWSANEEMASMRDGFGDDWFLLFSPAGAALKGFAHELASENEIAQHIQDMVPESFSSFLQEPAFSMQYATFCYWCLANESIWKKVPSSERADGSTQLLDLLVTGPSGYKEWADSYYEVTIPIDVITAIYEHAPLKDSIIQTLNPDAELSYTFSQAEEIGYPIQRA